MEGNERASRGASSAACVDIGVRTCWGGAAGAAAGFTNGAAEGGSARATSRKRVCARANGPRPHTAPRAAPRRAGLPSSEYVKLHGDGARSGGESAAAAAAHGGRGVLTHRSPGEVCALCASLPPSHPVACAVAHAMVAWLAPR
jgi:hypothetical protein